MPEVLLGLGGNIGDPLATIAAALDYLEQGGLRILRRSRGYRTPPWGKADQPDFVNLCAAAETELAPREVLDLIHAVEAALGRERRERWGPRLIDVDILAYGDERIEEPGLTVPHPRLTERAFVLVPLLDIAPDRVIAGKSVREWATTVDRSGITPVEPGKTD